MSSARLSFAIGALVLVPLGLLTRFYSGPGSEWVATQAGGFLYVVFWVFMVLAIAPGLRAGVVSAAVFTVACALEILQLWHPPLLTQLRSTFLGHALLGSTFSWLDIPYYAAGCLVAYATARIVQSQSDAPAA